ncbi:MAG: O-antigen ligase family protein [Actinobacteria bacterium]|nr:O-antigen ligase family protein [Actinomycetota bacterium]
MKTNKYFEALSRLTRLLMILGFLTIFVILVYLRGGALLHHRSPLWLILIFLVFIQTIFLALKKKNIATTPLGLPILLLCVVYGIFIFYSYAPEKSWLEFNNILIYALVFFFISHVIQDKTDAHLFTYSIVLIGLMFVLQSLYSLIFKIPGAVFIEEGRIRILGAFGYANIFGIFLVMILPLAVYLIRISKSQWMELFIACIASLIIISPKEIRFHYTTNVISFVVPAVFFLDKIGQSAFFIAASASGLHYRFALFSFFLLIFGSLLSTVFSVIISRKMRDRSNHIIKGLMYILVVNIIVFVIFGSFLTKRFIDSNIRIGGKSKQQLQTENLLSLANQQQPQISDRLSFWSLSIESIKENPLWGTGPGTFYLNLLIRQRKPRVAVDPHNLYLRLLSELGILGFLPIAVILVLFMSLTTSLLTRKIKIETNSPIPAYTAGALGFLVHSSIDMEWIFPAVILLFFSYLGFIYSQYNVQSTPGLGTIYTIGQIKSMTKKGYQESGTHHQIGTAFCKIKYFLVLFICIIAFLSVLLPFNSERLLVSGKKDREDLSWKSAIQKIDRAKMFNPFLTSATGHPDR